MLIFPIALPRCLNLFWPVPGRVAPGSGSIRSGHQIRVNYKSQLIALFQPVMTLYRNARYLSSAPNLKTAPPDDGFEVAFAGRSNAGKSSAINAITGQKALARVSKTPGRTQLLNFFELDGQRRLVDLPGYGYAQVPEAVQRTWGAMIEGFLSRRRSLRGVFLVMDIRHPLTAFDCTMLEWCRHWNLPVHVALTKADKLSRSAGLDTLRRIGKDLEAESGLAVTFQLFSALKQQGVEEAQAVLDRWLDVPPVPGRGGHSSGFSGA
jgi:GTP-binding protein